MMISIMQLRIKIMAKVFPAPTIVQAQFCLSYTNSFNPLSIEEVATVTLTI
jgi:hypothetical protein